MDMFSLGWRDGILLVVVLAALYLVVMLFRLIQVGRRRPDRTMPPPAPRIDPVSPQRRMRATEPDVAEVPALQVSPVAAVSAYAEEAAAQEAFAVPPAPTFEWDDVQELFGDTAVAPAPLAAAQRPAPEVPRPSASPGGLRAQSGFGESLADHLARSDMEMEVQRMRDEMSRMRAEMEELRAARRVSPQYAEAMELVQRGLSAQDVADQLGISLAEAELVQALSRGEANFEEGDEHGAEGYAANDGYDAFGSGRHR